MSMLRVIIHMKKRGKNRGKIKKAKWTVNISVSEPDIIHWLMTRGKTEVKTS